MGTPKRIQRRIVLIIKSKVLFPSRSCSASRPDNPEAPRGKARDLKGGRLACDQVVQGNPPMAPRICLLHCAVLNVKLGTAPSLV
eukprot:5749132-Pyramimonas_sp.AAC.1